jgi:hypothetical protein
MNHDQLKRQMIFRLVVVFLITVVVGFIVQDIQTKFELANTDQTVTDMR